MTEWGPATEAETAMRDALRVGDQEQYFRILARVDLLLPVSSESISGRAPMGWGTWTAGSRTHVLAFTSSEAMYACLAEHAGSARKMPFRELAASWPNLEWWLAVNPGLPIEGYLPAWFVSQLARGDVRLPGRPMGARARIERVESLGRARVAGPEQATAGQPAGHTAAGPMTAGQPQTGPAQGPATQRAAPAQPAPRTAPAQPDPLTAPARSGPPSRTAPKLTQAFPTRGPTRPAAPPAVESAPAPRPPQRPPAQVSPALGPTQGLPPRGPSRHGAPAQGPPTRTSSTPASPAPAEPEPELDFTPGNDLERELLAAHQTGNTGTYLSVLLLAKVLLPIADGTDASLRPGQEGFAWRTEKIDNQVCVVVFTSSERITAHLAEPLTTIGVRFVQMIRAWPDESWSLAVNPGTAIGVTLPGGQITALASSAAEVGLGDDAGEAGESGAGATSRASEFTVHSGDRPIRMQKAVAPDQVGWYLERGYDRVSGFVHREEEAAHLRTPSTLLAGLGLSYQGSPFAGVSDEVHVLRWSAYRHSLYRIPYGGRNETAMAAMEGWVIERAPFRGNGFAPADSGDVIAEFKVDSVRLPHGAQLWRLRTDGASQLVAVLDADGPTWRQVEAEG